MNYLIVLGAAIGAGLVALMGHTWGWPFLIGFAVGAFCGYSHRQIIEKESQQKAQGESR